MNPLKLGFIGSGFIAHFMAEAIKKIQLMHTSEGWKIVSLIWQEEDQSLPLLNEYLLDSNSTSQPIK